MSNGLSSIQQSFIRGNPARLDKNDSDNPITKNHVLKVVTNPNEQGRAKAAELSTRGGFRQSMVSFFSKIFASNYSLGNKLERNNVINDCNALVEKIKANPKDPSIKNDVSALHQRLGALKESNPSAYASVACLVEDAFASMPAPKLKAFIHSLSDSQRLELFMEDLKAEGRKSNKRLEDDLFTIIGKGAAKNIAAEIVSGTNGSAHQMREKYTELTYPFAEKSPGMGFHIVSNVLLFEHVNQHGENAPKAQINFVINHPLTSALGANNSAMGAGYQDKSKNQSENKVKNFINNKLNGER